jgi:bifunctional non-homologous end joining protein LigD
VTTLSDLLSGTPKKRQPDWVDPMLATLTRDYFSDDEWIFEPKLDGIRCLAFRTGKKVRLLTRNKLSLNERFPVVEEAVAAQGPGNFIIDGEIAATTKGRTSFGALQQRLYVEGKRGRPTLHFHVFDVLHIEGHDVQKLDVLTRKKILKAALTPGPHLKLVGHRKGAGEAYLEEACAKGWEGLIAKRASAPYQQGRSKEWLKFKCTGEQELVIGGYTDPQGARTGFGALLVGYFDGPRFKYAGKVGTGYNDKLLKSLTERMQKLEIDESPFEGKPPLRKGVHWVRPELVAQIGFSEWTGDAKLRHPRFLGLRTDKAAKDVVRETPV